MNECVHDEPKASRALERRISRVALQSERPFLNWRAIASIVTEPGFASRAIRHVLKIPQPLNTTDRILLETRIFPHYTRDLGVKCVLFVGCDSYTAHYEKEFFPGRHYVTIEPDGTKQRFAGEHHIVGVLEELSEHVGPGEFDLIVCNGVYGWGLDTLEQCETAFAGCYSSLRPNGHLLLGWNDVPLHRPVPFAEIPSLMRFRPYDFPQLGTQYLTDTPFRHTYSFFQK